MRILAEIFAYNKSTIGKLTDSYSNFFYLQDGNLLGFKFYGNCTSMGSYSTPPNYTSAISIDDICASIFVDVNGTKNPNKLGSDQYIIPIDSRGIKFDNT